MNRDHTPKINYLIQRSGGIDPLNREAQDQAILLLTEDNS
jgi:hypothetical protein